MRRKEACLGVVFPMPPANENFTFECGPSDSECQAANIFCPENADCHIICNGPFSCKDAHIHWGNNNNVLTCDQSPESWTNQTCSNVNRPPTTNPNYSSNY